MPFMDGYQATREIRQFAQQSGLEQPKILAATGHTEDAYLQIAIESGMD